MEHELRRSHVVIEHQAISDAYVHQISRQRLQTSSLPGFSGCLNLGPSACFYRRTLRYGWLALTGDEKSREMKTKVLQGTGLTPPS